MTQVLLNVINTGATANEMRRIQIVYDLENIRSMILPKLQYHFFEFEWVRIALRLNHSFTVLNIGHTFRKHIEQ